MLIYLVLYCVKHTYKYYSVVFKYRARFPRREKTISDNEIKKPTVNDLCKWIEGNEGNVWDEYISVWDYPSQEKTNLEDIVYNEGRLICNPHYGGNEGAYLEIYHQTINDKNQIIINHLITCKTLDSSPEKMIRCFESAGRIYNHIFELV